MKATLSKLAAVLTATVLSTGTSNAFSVNRVFVSTPSQTQQSSLVQDCMTPNPICLKSTDGLDEAIQQLLNLGFNGAPVVDPTSRNLVGVISAFDFLQKEEGGTLLPFAQNGSRQDLQDTADAARKICAKTVQDLMTESPLTIPPTMSMREAAELMTRDRCHRLCVVDEEGSLIGILATSDVMKHVLKVVRQALPENASIEDAVLDNKNLSP
jgi:CBS domain-containing protein